VNNVLQIPPPHLTLIEKYYLNPGGPYKGIDLSAFLKNIPHLATRDDLPATHISEISEIFNKGISQVISGEKAPEIFLAEVGPQINAILAGK